MISCKNFRLYYEDDRYSLDMHKVGLWVEELVIPSQNPEHVTESADGINGLIYFSTALKEREISATLQYEVERGETMLSFNRKIFDWFNPFREYFLVADEDPGVRYPVRVSAGYEIDEISWEDGKFNIEFVMFKPLAESVNVVTRKYNVDTSFNYRNEGNTQIDMRHQEETEITFKGASSGLTITNISTGDEWKYNESTTANDLILLKGVRSFKNGQSIFGKTNHRMISFAVGNNEFKITGNIGAFELTIRTRFYFL